MAKSKLEEYTPGTFPGATPTVDKTLQGLLDLEEPLKAVVWDVPDVPRAAVNNVLGAISQLKSAIKTEKTLREARS